MRKCLRCDETMVENYMLKTENLTAIGPVILGTYDSILKSKNIGKIKAAICPKCGEISIFIDSLDKINK